MFRLNISPLAILLNILKERACVALYAKFYNISGCLLDSSLLLSVFSSFEVASSASASGM